MDERGYFFLHRKIEEDELHPLNRPEPFTEYEAWIDLISLANWKDGFFMGLVCKRGQLLRSLSNLSLRWKWSRSKVQRFIGKLREQRKIDTLSETITIRITIIKYDTYQDNRYDVDTLTDTQAIRERALSNTNNKERIINTGPEPSFKNIETAEVLSPLNAELTVLYDEWKSNCLEQGYPITGQQQTTKIRRDLMRWGVKKSQNIIDRCIKNKWKSLDEKYYQPEPNQKIPGRPSQPPLF